MCSYCQYDCVTAMRSGRLKLGGRSSGADVSADRRDHPGLVPEQLLSEVIVFELCQAGVYGFLPIGLPRRRHAARRLAIPIALLAVLRDADPEVRAQAVKILGEHPERADFRPLLAEALRDESNRVRFFAALGLGRHMPTVSRSNQTYFAALLTAIRENNNTDATTTFANITGSNRSLTFNGSGNTTVSGNITTGNQGLTKNNSGELRLEGARKLARE